MKIKINKNFNNRLEPIFMNDKDLSSDYYMNKYLSQKIGLVQAAIEGGGLIYKHERYDESDVIKMAMEDENEMH